MAMTSSLHNLGGLSRARPQRRPGRNRRRPAAASAVRRGWTHTGTPPRTPCPGRGRSARSDNPAAPWSTRWRRPSSTILRLDLFPRFLAFAHAASLTQPRSPLLLFDVGCGSVLVIESTALNANTADREDAADVHAIRGTEPRRRAANMAMRWLAEMGISIAGTQALRVRGRKTGEVRARSDQPADRRRRRLRGLTAWQHPVGTQRQGRRRRRDRAALAPAARRDHEVHDAAKPELLRRYLARWYWQVKDYVAGLTPDSDRRAVAAPPHRRSRCSRSPPKTSAVSLPPKCGRRAEVLADLLGGGLPRHRRGEIPPDAVEDPDDLRGAAGVQVHGSARITLLALTPWDMVNHPLLTLSTVPQVSRGDHAEMADRLAGRPVPRIRRRCQGRPPGRMLFTGRPRSSTIAS